MSYLSLVSCIRKKGEQGSTRSLENFKKLDLSLSFHSSQYIHNLILCMFAPNWVKTLHLFVLKIVFFWRPVQGLPSKHVILEQSQAKLKLGDAVSYGVEKKHNYKNTGSCRLQTDLSSLEVNTVLGANHNISFQLPLVGLLTLRDTRVQLVILRKKSGF